MRNTQSLTVSHELIRVAMLWHELWHEYLEEASRLYFTEKNADAMITHLETLHQLMEQVSTLHFFLEITITFPIGPSNK